MLYKVAFELQMYCICFSTCICSHTTMPTGGALARVKNLTQSIKKDAGTINTDNISNATNSYYKETWYTVTTKRFMSHLMHDVTAHPGTCRRGHHVHCGSCLPPGPPWQ